MTSSFSPSSSSINLNLELYSKGARAWLHSSALSDSSNLNKSEEWLSCQIVKLDKHSNSLTLRLLPKNTDSISDNSDSLNAADPETSDNSSLIKLQISSDYSNLPHLANPSQMDGVDDLTLLTYLHEPGVLHAIRSRYTRSSTIYTFSGIVLIAINPFTRLPLYSSDIALTYSGKRRVDGLEPHLFSIAEEAFRDLVDFGSNQSIIVSGESGAGKTVSAKYLMRYFATVGAALSQNGSSRGGRTRSLSVRESSNESLYGGSTGQVEDQVLATNPIMEAFGNAKTIRNDNSSRFGKYIEIQFSKENTIVGARMRTYLLERSRVVFQPENERNYHIFYQLCAGCPSAEKKDLGLSSWDSFSYLMGGGAFHSTSASGKEIPTSLRKTTGIINGVNDSEEFQSTVKALSVVGVSVGMQWNIFRIAAAILHMGNISPVTKEMVEDPSMASSLSTRSTLSEQAYIVSDSVSLGLTCRLLGIERDSFIKCLTEKIIVTRSEKIKSQLSISQCCAARDAVAKYIYHTLFSWIVSKINESLGASADATHTQSLRFIGVLDIYGFEHFKKNSFEQFCINYANEKLQQEFNQHVFKLEQQEYLKEEINWSFIDFNDNQPCIELIEGKLGILDLLNEESRLPSGTDSSFISKIFNQYPVSNQKGAADLVGLKKMGSKLKADYLSRPRFSQTAFVIHHYAHHVDYDVEGFLEKNKDTMPEDVFGLLASSSDDFVAKLFEPAFNELQLQKQHSQESAPVGSLNPTKKLALKSSLSSLFKVSLEQLMTTIRSTNVHYIRCIKPNEEKTPFNFNSSYVLSQLRACGVLETIRISCAGYPSRFGLEEFRDRYRMLVHSRYWGSKGRGDPRDTSKIILETVFNNQDAYQVGLSKVFLRAGRLAYLERCRSETLFQKTTLIQKNYKRLKCQREFRELKRATIRIQTAFRSYRARETARTMKKEKIVTILQAYARAVILRSHVQRKLALIRKLQTFSRGTLVRLRLKKEKLLRATVAIQSIYRGDLSRRKFQSRLSRIIIIQSLVRRWHAKRQLRSLRLEARSLNTVQQKAGALEKKVFELTVHLAEKEQNNAELEKHLNDANDSIAYLKERLAKLEQINTGLEKKMKAAEIEAKVNADSLLKENGRLAQKIKEMEVLLESKENEMGKLIAESEKMQHLMEKQIQDLAQNSTKEENARLLQLQAENVMLKEKIMKAFNRTKQPSSSVPSPLVHEHDIDRDANFQDLNPDHVVVGEGIRSRSSSRESADTGKMAVRPSAEGSRSSSLIAVELQRRSSTSATAEISKLFHDPLLDREIANLLILHLPIPPTLPTSIRGKKEVTFPAHLIGLSAIHCWRFGYLDRVRSILGSTIKNIHSQLKYDDNCLCAFWLSNLYELGCILCSVQEDRNSRSSLNNVDGELDRTMSKFRTEIDYLMMDIYNNWLQELRKSIVKFAIPCILEHQGLPGFVENSVSGAQGGLFSKWMSGGYSGQSEANNIPIEKLIMWLTKINGIMESYYMEDSIRRQIIAVLIRTLGTNSFNQLLVRKNFCSWRRGMQIQYNITRVEEWCSKSEVAEAAIHLEPIMQAAKLLQLNKSSADDAEIMFDLCFLLSPIQIRKILTIYYGGEFDEHPVSQVAIKAVSARCVNDSDASLLLEVGDNPAFVIPPASPITRIDRFIPLFIESKVVALKQVTSI